MNGYSKLQIIENSTETRCSSSDLVPKADYSDQSKKMETPESNYHEMKVPNPSRDSPAAEVEGGGDQEGCGPNYLRRNSSVASAYALQSAVKRAFSMTRSASSSSSASCDRYCRIHDQAAVSATSPLDDDNDQQVMGAGRRGSETKIRRSGTGKQLVKAWKKIFGMKY